MNIQAKALDFARKNFDAEHPSISNDVAHLDESIAQRNKTCAVMRNKLYLTSLVAIGVVFANAVPEGIPGLGISLTGVAQTRLLGILGIVTGYFAIRFLIHERLLSCDRKALSCAEGFLLGATKTLGILNLRDHVRGEIAESTRSALLQRLAYGMDFVLPQIVGFGATLACWGRALGLF